jgi:hypothetical protein
LEGRNHFWVESRAWGLPLSVWGSACVCLITWSAGVVGALKSCFIISFKVITDKGDNGSGLVVSHVNSRYFSL